MSTSASYVRSGSRRSVGLSLERLESRLMLSVVSGAGVENPQTLDFTDASGDSLRVTFAGPVGSQVEILDPTGGSDISGDDIGSIVFTGTNALSTFSIEDTNPGTGGDSIEIVGGPSPQGVLTAGSEDMGAVVLGVQQDGTQAGLVSFAVGTGVEVGGSLGAFATSGSLEFDDGQMFVNAGGDIGAVFTLGNIVLDGTTGVADIRAGATGGGDIGFIFFDEVFDGTGGSPVDEQSFTPGSPVTINDDAGTGTSGRLRFIGSGSVVAVPVVGDGSVVGLVDLDGNSTIVGLGTGGDVSELESEAANNRLRVVGSPDIDLGLVGAEGGVWLQNVSNFSRGGDILSVTAPDGAGTIQTGPGGNIGSVFTGATNSTPLFPQVLQVGGVFVEGSAERIRTGTLSSAQVMIESNLLELNLGRGGIYRSDVWIGGNLDRAFTSYTQESDLWVGGLGRTLMVNGQGAHRTDFTYVGGVDTVIIRGGANQVDFSTVDTSGSSPVGGGVGRFIADELRSVEMDVLDGFGSFIVNGAVVNTGVSTRFFDSGLGQDVGGGIGTLRTGYVVDSFFDAFADIDFVRTGTQVNTEFEVGGDVRSVTLAGDMVGAEFDVAGNVLGVFNVLGDLLDSGSGINVEGGAGAIFIAGSLADSDGVFVGGNAERIVVRGGGTDSDVEVGGNARFISVNFLDDFSAVEVDGNADVVIVGKMDDDSEILVGGGSQRISVGGMHEDSRLDVSGDLGALIIGQFSGGSEILIGGNSRRMVIRQATSLDEIFIGGNAGTIVMSGLGGAIDGDFDSLSMGGTLGLLRIANGLLDYGIFVEGDVQRGIFIAGGSDDVDIEVQGFLPVLNLGGAFVDGEIEADAGFGTVMGRFVAETDIESRRWDSGSGDPTGGGIQSLRLMGAYDLEIDLHQDLERIQVAYAFKDSSIELTARDNFGSGSIVGGGGIGSANLPELSGSTIRTYGRLGRITVGAKGVDRESWIQTLSDTEGNVGRFITPGLFFGDALIRGDVDFWRTGGMAVGPLAPFESPLDSVEVDRIFTDSDGSPTDGTFAVRGQIQLIF